MIRLIKNELIKIFKKKFIYWILIIFFLFSMVNTYFKKTATEFDSVSHIIVELTVKLNEMTELETYNQIREYADTKAQLDRYKLMVEYGKGKT